ncbi:LacI family DNA-binding transcriptional regulator [Floccifex sp.]|uniref:LacI family DNA-binding transcriptional regulator n=1 Tax=Floccifex sp. TaxID=2815810 RepID=UPI002A752E94|nr:LacI family DNA-binding transcriptional regulator [Floccifex sp.]MDD7282041.1 LacI family DNA-binding transcriptional regulator [Erysipelotrichaceae bacterium]MDY2958103.1 LacI family DNA-binding transcriptional regulator [Floccifex sp.]
MKRITIYDVAKEADVSLATVSRVINDSNVVREDTRIRVQQAIEKLGYKPNAIAQGLALSKTTTISIVMSERLIAYNAKILSGLMNIASTYHYNIMFHVISKGINEMSDIVESIIKTHVDGVILFNDDFSQDEMEALLVYQIPIVIVGSKIEETKLPNVANVYVDFEKLAYNLVNSYFDKGITDIALVEDKLNMYMMDRLKAGFEKAYRERGMEFTNYISFDDTYKNSYIYLSNYFKKNKPSQLIVTFRDSQAVAVMNSLKETGYSVPEDSELICILNNKYLTMVRPNITSYSLPEYDMGTIAMRLLQKMLMDQPGKNRFIEQNFSMIPRQTTK